MTSNYQIKVFGKQGCDKCHTLNQRLDKLLTQETFSDFGTLYCDVDSIEGLVAFAEAGCINPARIPAMLVTKWDADAEEFVPLATQQPGAKDDVCKKAKLYQYLGLQTDYSDVGKGLITPKMIQSILVEATA